jgi:hypothetical protein
VYIDSTIPSAIGEEEGGGLRKRVPKAVTEEVNGEKVEVWEEGDGWRRTWRYERGNQREEEDEETDFLYGEECDVQEEPQSYWPEGGRGQPWWGGRGRAGSRRHGIGVFPLYESCTRDASGWGRAPRAFRLSLKFLSTCRGLTTNRMVVSVLWLFSFLSTGDNGLVLSVSRSNRMLSWPAN